MFKFLIIIKYLLFFEKFIIIQISSSHNLPKTGKIFQEYFSTLLVPGIRATGNGKFTERNFKITDMITEGKK